MPTLSNAHLILIGRAVVACAELEAQMYGAIVRVLGLDSEDGLMVTRRLEPDGRIDILRKLAVRYLEWPQAREFIDLLHVIEMQLKERDCIVCAEWNTHRKGFLTLSARTPTGYRTDTFTPARLVHITDAVNESRTGFEAYSARMERGRIEAKA
ncbi:MAG: hypothetical protein ACREHE_06115 [Rhizomicrobium sp.]